MDKDFCLKMKFQKLSEAKIKKSIFEDGKLLKL